MKTLTITRGLPAASKTTWAKQQVKNNKSVIRVNRDDLRAMLFNDICLDKREDFITKVQRQIITDAINDSKDVIADDCNLNQKVLDSWTTFANSINAKLEIKDFRDISLATCIERDKGRTGNGRVGRAVIANMALKAGMIDFSTHNEWAVIDIDGTIADITIRREYSTINGKLNWDVFFKDVSKDTVREDVRAMVDDCRDKGMGIMFVSGRPTDRCGVATQQWLDENAIPYHHLFMRKAKDSRSDVDIKGDILRLLPKDQIETVIDDRPIMVRFWKEQFKNTSTNVIDVGDGIEF